MSFQLDEYFARIGYDGDRTPSLETLQQIVVKHTQTIPFENLDPVLDRPVRLDVASLQQKLIHEGRGGYCYEQNLLLQHALNAMGFRAAGLAARVVFRKPPNAPLPRTHMLLSIEYDNTTYLADVGFGGLTMTGLLRLETDIVQDTPHERRRILTDGDELLMQVNIRDEWETLYRFDLQEQLLQDFIVYNWYISTYPDSHFRHQLYVARPAPEGRYALRNNEFAFHDLEGNTDRRIVSSVDDLLTLLQDKFLIRVPENIDLDVLEEKLKRGNAGVTLA